MPTPKNDIAHQELIEVLEALIANDVDITAREVARRHTKFSSASTITRHLERRGIMESYQARQLELRQWKGRLVKTSRDIVAGRLVSQEETVKELTRKVEALTLSHLALIAAVAEVGGMAKLSKFYSSFKAVRETLYEMGALPVELPFSELEAISMRMRSKLGD